MRGRASLDRQQRRPSPQPSRRRRGGRGRHAASPGALLASAYPDRIAMARGRRGEFLMANDGRRRSRGTTGSPKSRSSPSARSPAARPRRAFCSPRRCRSTISRGSPAARSRRRTNSPSTAPRRLCGRDAAAGSARWCWPSRRLRSRKTRRPRSPWRGRPFAWAGALALDRDRQAMAATASCFCAGPKATHGPTCRTRRSPRPRLAGAVPRGQDPAPRDRRRRPRQGARRASSVRSRAPPRRRGADPFPRADRDPSADRLRGRRRACDSLRVQELFGLKEHPSLAGGRIPLTLELLRPPIARSRSPATCRASGAAPGPPSAPISAAATPVIPGPRTPRPPRRRRVGQPRGTRMRERGAFHAAVMRTGSRVQPRRVLFRSGAPRRRARCARKRARQRREQRFRLRASPATVPHTYGRRRRRRHGRVGRPMS